VRGRLDAYYHGAAVLELEKGADGLGTVARIVLPRHDHESREAGR